MPRQRYENLLEFAMVGMAGLMDFRGLTSVPVPEGTPVEQHGGDPSVGIFMTV